LLAASWRALGSETSRSANGDNHDINGSTSQNLAKEKLIPNIPETSTSCSDLYVCFRRDLYIFYASLAKREGALHTTSRSRSFVLVSTIL
jgi:hypothetical protein